MRHLILAVALVAVSAAAQGATLARPKIHIASPKAQRGGTFTLSARAAKPSSAGATVENAALLKSALTPAHSSGPIASAFKTGLADIAQGAKAAGGEVAGHGAATGNAMKVLGGLAVDASKLDPNAKGLATAGNALQSMGTTLSKDAPVAGLALKLTAAGASGAAKVIPGKPAKPSLFAKVGADLRADFGRLSPTTQKDLTTAAHDVTVGSADLKGALSSISGIAKTGNTVVSTNGTLVGGAIDLAGKLAVDASKLAAPVDPTLAKIADVGGLAAERIGGDIIKDSPKVAGGLGTLATDTSTIAKALPGAANAGFLASLGAKAGDFLNRLFPRTDAELHSVGNRLERDLPAGLKTDVAQIGQDAKTAENFIAANTDTGKVLEVAGKGAVDLGRIAAPFEPRVGNAVAAVGEGAEKVGAAIVRDAPTAEKALGTIATDSTLAQKVLPGTVNAKEPGLFTRLGDKINAFFAGADPAFEADLQKVEQHVELKPHPELKAVLTDVSHDATAIEGALDAHGTQTGKVLEVAGTAAADLGTVAAHFAPQVAVPTIAAGKVLDLAGQALVKDTPKIDQALNTLATDTAAFAKAIPGATKTLGTGLSGSPIVKTAAGDVKLALNDVAKVDGVVAASADNIQTAQPLLKGLETALGKVSPVAANDVRSADKTVDGLAQLMAK